MHSDHKLLVTDTLMHDAQSKTLAKKIGELLKRIVTSLIQNWISHIYFMSSWMETIDTPDCGLVKRPVVCHFFKE